MKKLSFIIYILLCVFLFVGCTNNDEDVTQDKSSVQEKDVIEEQSEVVTETTEEIEELHPLAIGVMPDTDSLPLILASSLGYYEEEGLEVTIVPFKSALDRDAALQAGQLDGAISDMLAVAFLNDNGFKVDITSKTSGSFKLIANGEKGIEAVTAINNNSIGISQNTIIEYLTDRMLETSGVSLDQVEKVAIPKIPTRLEMLQYGNIDMATLPEPLASLAVLNGGKALSSSDALNIDLGLIIFKDETINSKATEIQGFYRAYNRAVDYLNEEPLENYIDIIIEEAGFPEPVRDTLVLPAYTHATMPSQDTWADVLLWLNSKELITEEFSFEEVSTDQFIN
ncbi:ABC transporter substrate-binding protein [Vallitalea okinawensis]|uniref:ABC transporter substrate-binding protein n=1 Tax=Vallitalea okinawensis TaxID=2078660 RepID=UPI001A9A5A0C|nr:MetQ/NlpA family ABC transporter substrate-binding protein [Vallitalea okinawensis]